MCDNDQECEKIVPTPIKPEPLPKQCSGGDESGGGTNDFNELDNRPKYGGQRMTGNTDIPAYSDFTGTDGQSDGAAGLVPAPTTTDAGKFLKSDGTWDTAGGGGGEPFMIYVDRTQNQLGNSVTFYKDTGLTIKYTVGEIYDAVSTNQRIVVIAKKANEDTYDSRGMRVIIAGYFPVTKSDEAMDESGMSLVFIENVNIGGDVGNVMGYRYYQTFNGLDVDADFYFGS